MALQALRDQHLILMVYLLSLLLVEVEVVHTHRAWLLQAAVEVVRVTVMELLARELLVKVITVAVPMVVRRILAVAVAVQVQWVHLEIQQPAVPEMFRLLQEQQ
jgi:hypothetical protein